MPVSSQRNFFVAILIVIGSANPVHEVRASAGSQSGFSVSAAVDRTFDPSKLSELIARGHELETSYFAVVLDIDWVPEGYLPDSEARSQRDVIQAAQAEVLSLLPPDIAALARHYPTTSTIEIPFSGVAVGAVARSPLVRRIEVTRDRGRPMLNQVRVSTQATVANARGARGQGWVVAVLDTGVNMVHDSLSGKVVAGHCFGTNNTFFESLCPGGGVSVAGISAAADCDENSINMCGHGSRMAGIIAGNGSLDGIAPDAGIISVKVFSRRKSNNTAEFTTADVNAGLQHVYGLRNTYNIAAANMSLGSGAHLGQCDADGSPLTQTTQLLRSVGIIPVAASGNAGEVTGNKHRLALPACLSHVVAVGSAERDRIDTPSAFSQSGAELEFLVPVHLADTPGPFSYPVEGGFTSGAAAAFSGALAVLRSRYVGGGPEAQLASLKSSGVPVADVAFTRPRPRLDLALAPNVTAQSWQCYGMTTVSWESVPTAATYVLEGSPLWGGPWYPIYSGPDTSRFIHIGEDTAFRVKACDSIGCGGYNASQGAYYYPHCH